METLKISIVGGGFAGLYAAYKLSEIHEITLYEEDERVGYPKHCTGLISKWTMKQIGSPALESLENFFNKITLKAGSSSIRFIRDSIAVKLDRVKLEEILLKEAKKNGVEIHMKQRVRTATPYGEVILSNSTKTLYDAVIIADGLYGRISSNLGLNKDYRKVLGVNLEIKTNHDFNVDEFTVIFDELFKGFFGWIVPISKNKLVIGGGSISLLKIPDILRALKLDGVIQSRYGGIILTGPPARKPYTESVFIIGDAAGLTKPFTGGGLYPNVRLVNCFRQNTLESWSKCINKVVKDLRSQVNIARIFQEDLSSRGIEELFKAVKKVRLDKVLSGRLDYDRHEELLKILRDNKLKTFNAGISFLANQPVLGVKLARRLLSTLFT
jgi:flavin-dependent dehydrogenase